jgi:polyhydroxyalkanoate synthesis regulator phasin
MVKNNDEYGFLIPENHQIHENAIQAMSFRDQVKKALALGIQSDDATIAEIHNLKTERSYYRGILDHLCDRLQLWANGFERLKDVRIVKTSEPENLAIDNRRPCSFSRRVNVLLDDNPDEILTVLGDDQMLARIEKMYNDLTAANEFRDQVKFLFGEGLSDDETIAAIKARRWDQNQSNRFVMAIKEVLNQGKLSDDEAIAKIKELSEQSQLLGEITDILNKANAECLDHFRSKQEEKIVLTGFRGLCDIHLALFKKRSEYEIYGSRIIDDLLNSVDLQAQKQAYDQEEIDILEMSVNANEIREKEFDMLLEEVTKLKSDLRIAKKVIARLVGE